MLNSVTQQQILDLLNVGLTSAEVRRRTGASRNAIRRLNRQLYSPRKAVRDKLESFDGFDDSQPVGRCPDCGALTRQPCWRCELLKRLDALQDESLDEPLDEPLDEQQAEPFIDPFGDLTAADSLFGLSLEAISLRGASIEYCELALKPEHRKRYEQVRRSRLNRGE